MAEGTPIASTTAATAGAGWLRLPDGVLVNLGSGLTAAITGAVLHLARRETVLAAHDYGSAADAERGRATLETLVAAVRPDWMGPTFEPVAGAEHYTTQEQGLTTDELPTTGSD